MATLLVDLISRNRPDFELTGFEFRALRPLFDDEPFRLCGKLQEDGHRIGLWAADPKGYLAFAHRPAAWRGFT